MIRIYEGDNLQLLKTLSDKTYNLIYVDPPYNTGRKQIRKRDTNSFGYDDTFDDFIGFLRPRFEEAHRILADDGSLFFQLDYREIHYCKVMLDEIFGRDCFMNEIIWAYDWGARSKTRWSCKHDNILWYVKDPKKYTFHYDQIDRVPYITKSEGLVSKEKQELGKTLTDVWWNTIVCGNEKNGYATQKPLKILERIVKVHSNKGDQCLDFFAGSGSFGEACAKNNRSCDLIDQNNDAIMVMRERFEKYGYELYSKA